MLLDATLHNENLIKLIFHNFNPLNNQCLLDKTTNKIISKVILSILNYKKMFKSIGKSQIILEGHKNWVKSLISLSDTLVLSASLDKTLKVWDINNYTCIATIVEDTIMYSLLKLPDGNIALSCYKSINIRNVNDTLKCIKSISYERYNSFNNLTLLIDSRMAFTAFKPESTCCIMISDIKDDYNIIKVVDVTENYISHLVSQSNILASNSCENIIKIWEINDNNDIEFVNQLAGHVDGIIALLFTIERLLLSCSNDDTIRLWNLEDYQCIKTIVHDWAAAMLLLPNGYFAVNSGANIMIYDLNDFSCISVLKGYYVLSCMLYIKGNRIFTGSVAKTIILWSY
jgi:WD40 repeat protein